MLSLLIHFPGLLLIRLIDLQGGKSLKVFQEAVPQPCIDPPVLVQQPFCHLLHCHDRHRDQGNAHQEHQAGIQADRGQGKEQSEGRQQAVKQLGKIPAKIDLQLLHPLHRHLHSGGRGNLLMVGRAKPCKFFVKPSAKFPFDIASCHAGSPGGLTVKDRAQEDGAQDKGCSAGQFKPAQPRSGQSCSGRPRRRVFINSLQQLSGRHHGDYGGQKTQPLPYDILNYIFF